MRILHIDTGRTMRGGQWQVLHLLRALSRLGHESRLLAQPHTLLFEESRMLGIETSVAGWRSVRAWSHQADIVHCHDARSHTLAGLWSSAPFVVSRRVVFPVKMGLISRWKYTRPSRYLAISEAAAAELAAAGVPREKIVVVHDAVPLPAALSRRDGPVIAIESSDPGKGNALLRRTGLEIQFTRDLAASLPHARALVYISESEGLGSAVLLAMAHGVPVVASRIGGLPEIVRDGETGLLAGNDTVEIAAAVRRLLEDPALEARLAANARRLVEQRFTIERMVEKTLAVYREVVS